MDYEADLEAIRAEMDADGEPRSPKEIAEHKVAMAVRDCYLASADLYRLRLDPIAAPFVAAQEGELWSVKTRMDLLISEIRAEHEAKSPMLKVVHRG